MVRNDPAKKKLLGSKVQYLSFLPGKSVEGIFVDLERHEGVGIKAQRWSDKMFSGIREPQYNES